MPVDFASQAEVLCIVFTHWICPPVPVAVDPACVTVKYCPEMVSVPVRGLVLVLAVTDHVTAPLPAPLGGVQVSQLGALLTGVHAQPAPAVTLNVPPPAVAPGLALPGESVYVQFTTAPACVTVNVWPAMDTEPLRWLAVVLAETL
jgi:hypothetical protein